MIVSGKMVCWFDKSVTRRTRQTGITPSTRNAGQAVLSPFYLKKDCASSPPSREERENGAGARLRPFDKVPADSPAGPICAKRKA